jgi:DNA-binding NtrC family response regulator
MTPLLLVDGDRNFGRALAIALQLDGIPVVTSPDVEDALRCLDREAFGACLVDCFLPGADALFSCLARQAGVRVFATGTHPELLASAARRHPWVTTLQKPFTPAAVAARLAGSAGQ